MIPYFNLGPSAVTSSDSTAKTCKISNRHSISNNQSKFFKILLSMSHKNIIDKVIEKRKNNLKSIKFLEKPKNTHKSKRNFIETREITR